MAIKFPKVSDFTGVDSSGKKLIPEEFESGEVLQDWTTRPLPEAFQRLEWVAGDDAATPHLDVGLLTYSSGGIPYYLAADFEFTFDGMLFGHDSPDKRMQAIGCLLVDNSGADPERVLGCYFGARLHYPEPRTEGEVDPPYICPVFCYGKNEVELDYYQMQTTAEGANWRAVDPGGYHRLRLDLTGMVLDGELLFPDEDVPIDERRSSLSFQILGAAFVDKDSRNSVFRAAHLPVRSIRLWKRYLTGAWNSNLPDSAPWPNYKPRKFVEERRPVLAYDLVACSSNGGAGMYDYVSGEFLSMGSLHVGPAYAERKTVSKFMHWTDSLRQVYLPGDFSTSKTRLSPDNTISAVYGDQTLAHYVVPCDGTAIDVGPDGSFDEGTFSGLDPVHTGKVEVDQDVGEIIHLGPWEYLKFGQSQDRAVDPFAGDSITIVGWFKPAQRGSVDCRYDTATKELSVTREPSPYGTSGDGGWGWHYIVALDRGDNVVGEEGDAGPGQHYLNGNPWYCIVNTNQVFAGFAGDEWTDDPPEWTAIGHEAWEFLNISLVNMNGGFVRTDLPNLEVPRWDSVYDCINSSGRLANAVGEVTKAATIDSFERIHGHWTFLAASFCPTTKMRFGYIRNENGTFLSTLAGETTIHDTRDVCRGNFGNPMLNYMPPRYTTELLRNYKLALPGNETYPPEPVGGIISGRAAGDIKYKYVKVLRRAMTIQEAEGIYEREREFFSGSRSAAPAKAARKSAPRGKKAVRTEGK